MSVPHLKQHEAVLDVVEIGLSDEQKIADIPRVDSSACPFMRPVPKSVQCGEQTIEGMAFLHERVLFRVVVTVLHEVPDHVRVTPVV